MFTVGDYRIQFYHFDKGKGSKRRRLTTCIILDKDTEVPLGIGRSQYNESDAKIGLPYSKGFARRNALKRAIEQINLSKEIKLEIWKKYYSMVSEEERSLLCKALEEKN